MTKDIHDKTFAQLLSDQRFVEDFFKTYLPVEIQNLIQWKSLSLYKMGGKHVQEKTHQISIADVIYLAKIDQEMGMLWIHFEHQAKPDRLMTLRIVNYQTAELLNYAKVNKLDKLPPIISLIYHQGEKPYPYSLALKDLFDNPIIGIKYFGVPVLIDLPSLSDEEINKHGNIAPVELLLKYIRRKDFEKNYRGIIAGLQQVHGDIRKIVLKYLIERSDISQEKLFETILEYLPKEENDMATVAEQLRYQGKQQGLQQGLQEGLQQGQHQARQEIAKVLLATGQSVTEIANITGLPETEVLSLQNKH